MQREKETMTIEFLFSKGRAGLLSRALRKGEETEKRIYFKWKAKGEAYDITFDKHTWTFSCTCKDASHFTVKRGMSCPHTVAVCTWLCLKKYPIITGEDWNRED